MKKMQLNYDWQFSAFVDMFYAGMALLLYQLHSAKDSHEEKSREKWRSVIRINEQQINNWQLQI